MKKGMDMARDKVKIKYVQLEPSAYATDIDWVGMHPFDRGCYHSLIIFLCCNGGQLPNNRSYLENLCNANPEQFKLFWERYSHKFIVKEKTVSHKRVNSELANARKRLRQKHLAGKASGEARRQRAEQRSNGRSTVVPTGVQRALQQSKVKVKESKGKESKELLLKFKGTSHLTYFNWFSDVFSVDVKNRREKNAFIKYAKICTLLAEENKNFNHFLTDTIMDITEKCKVEGQSALAGKKMFTGWLKKNFPEFW